MFLRAFATALILTSGFLGNLALGQELSNPVTFHLIVVNEVYTNADGTKQFAELMARSDFQTNLAPTRINALDATGAATTLVFDLTASFPALDNNETILLATQAVASQLGFSPDFIIPPNAISLVNGRVSFAQDPAINTIVDAVAYGNYTGSNTGFGTPSVALPSDGSTSLNRVVYNLITRDNATDFAVLVNSPKRNDGMSGTLVGVNEQQGIPSAYELHQNYPNPFNPSTTITYTVPAATYAQLSVFDVLGKQVASLVDGGVEAGTHQVNFDAQASGLSSGVYLYRLTTPSYVGTRVMTIVK